MRLGWSREDLARYSGVSVASVYLIERLGSSSENDDARMRDALARALAARGAELSRRSEPIECNTGADIPAWDLDAGLQAGQGSD